MNIKLVAFSGLLISAFSMFAMDEEKLVDNTNLQHFNTTSNDQSKNIIELLLKISDKFDTFQKETTNNFEVLNKKFDDNAKRLETMEEQIEKMKTFVFENGAHQNNLIKTIRNTVCPENNGEFNKMNANKKKKLKKNKELNN